MTASARTHDRREVTWNLVLQYSTVTLMLVQGVLLVPLYLKFVGSAEFGVWLVASGVATWIAIVDPGVATLMQQRISQALGGARPGQAVRFARQGLRLSLLLAAIVVAAGGLGAGWLLGAIDPKGQVPADAGWWLLFLSVVGVALGLLGNYATAVGVALRDARPHTIIAVASALAGIVATLALLWRGAGVLALPGGVVVRGALQTLFALRIVRGELAHVQALGAADATEGNDAPTDARALAWLALEKLTGTFAMSADLFLIGRVLDGGMVTSYALTRRPADMLLSLFQRPVVALAPTVSFLAGGEKSARLGDVVAQSCVRLLWLLGGAALGTLLLLEPLVGAWVGPEQFLGAGAAPLLTLTLAAGVVAGLFSNLYWASGATAQFCRINSMLSLLTIAGMVIGLNFFGVTGLLVGALLPRLLIATWLFPRLALRALRIEGAPRRAIGVEALAVGAAVAAGASGALGLRHAALGSAWAQGFAGLGLYAVSLALVSSGLRREMRALTA